MNNVHCEDCKFANWYFALFPEDFYLKYGCIYIPEQFDVYCKLNNKFFLETEITGNCKDGIYGNNNYHNICKNYYKQKSIETNKIKNELQLKEHDS